MEIQQLYKLFIESGTVATDSRTIRGGEIFFALKGDNFDGNEYALKALEAGASYAVVNERSAAAMSCNERIVPVSDTLSTLQALGRYHRENTFVGGKRLTVIGLTGTNGKTTTKELISRVLAKKYKVTATEGNLNNDIGVPLSLLRINKDTEIAVIEMGANHPDDIAHLASICEPDYGLITNVGKAHLLGFGGFEGVIKAKCQLYDYIQSNGKAVFLNADDNILCEMASARYGMKTIRYGINYNGVEVLPTDACHPFLKMSIPSPCGDKYVLETRLVGAYNADNIMAAIAVGMEFGISLEDAVEAISKYIPSNNRSQMLRTNYNMLIVDAYNANPTSMVAALDNFKNIVDDNKIALLGDMMELGQYSVSEHQRILMKLKNSGLAKVFLVGSEFRKALDIVGADDNIKWFADSESIVEYLKNNRLNNSIILIKGSRGIMMEKTIPYL